MVLARDWSSRRCWSSKINDNVSVFRLATERKNKCISPINRYHTVLGLFIIARYISWYIALHIARYITRYIAGFAGYIARYVAWYIAGYIAGNIDGYIARYIAW